MKYQVIFKSDSLATVQFVIAVESSGSLGHIISGIRSSLHFCSWSLHHLKWDHNRVAHELAQLAKLAGFAQVWKGTSPPLPHSILFPDPT